MSSEFEGCYESYLVYPLDIGFVNGEFTRFNAPFLYHDKDSFPVLNIEPATETVDHEALEHPHHPLQGEYTSAGTSELGVVPSQLMLQNTGFDADALHKIDQSDGDKNDAAAWSCPWLSCCKVLSNPSKEAITSHFKDHRDIYNQLPGKWSPSTTCDWSKCSSKAIFKTPSSYQTHIYNIHVNPLICDVPGCFCVKPFGKRCDLKRHKSTAHGDAGHVECPIHGCETRARKDKLQEHMRKYHRKLRCPYNHCTATVIEGQEEAHLRESHGFYECGLGACEAGLKSRFQINRLKHHARNQHGVEYWTTYNVDIDLKNVPDKTLRANMYVGKRSMKKDCKECLLKCVQG